MVAVTSSAEMMPEPTAPEPDAFSVMVPKVFVMAPRATTDPLEAAT
jgi:hypothetical protein